MKKNILYIIDLDRTLIDIERVMEVTEKVCLEHGIDFKKILADHRELAKSGTAYSPFKYISSYKGVDIDLFKKRFIELSKIDNLLFTDSREFLDRLKEKKMDYLILTYGADRSWQELKLQAAGLFDTPYVIVEDRYKSRFIKNWNKGKDFISPGVKGLGSYSKSILVDDRPIAFIDKPDNCQGYLLTRAGSPQMTSAGLPTDLQVIKSLVEIEI